MFKTLWNKILGDAPQSLVTLARKPRPASTSGLYVLRIDFQISKQKAQELSEQLDPIRKKYGLDFLVLEPGFQLRRFDDF